MSLSSTTEAQIRCFWEAFIDRLAYKAGTAPEMWIKEPLHPPLRYIRPSRGRTCTEKRIGLR